MTARWTRTVVLLLAALAVVPVHVAGSRPDDVEPQGVEALNHAFRLASALHTDLKDMGRAQEAVVLDFARLGHLDLAVEHAPQVTGWRRGSVFADLAAMLAEVGRKEDAKKLLAAAESFGREIEGWQHTRIEAHIAQAYAQLGDVDRARDLSGRTATGDPRQYTGRAMATLARAQAEGGDFAMAMETLSGLNEQKDFDIVWWRTMGYLELAREQHVDEVLRPQAVNAARASADGIDGWKQMEALAMIAKEYRTLELPKQAREALQRAQDQAVNLPDTMPVKASLLSMLARESAAQGAEPEARRLLLAAEKAVPATMVIDRPAMFGQVAAGWSSLGDAAETSRVLDRAFAATEALQNSRPRALAAVEVCRSIAQHDIQWSDEISRRLESIFSGLGDPW